jgi:hypothetical protein
MILKRYQIYGWTVLKEQKSKVFDDYCSWSGYKDIPTFSNSQRITSPCFRQKVDLENWIRNYEKHHTV